MLRSLCIFVLALWTSAADAQTPSPLQPADIFALEAASDPRISPDGRRIVYVRRANSAATDSAHQSLWIIDTDGSDHLPIATGEQNAFSPRWSPSGDRIAYIREVENGVAIHVYWLDDDRDAEIMRAQGGIQGLRWSPDGSRLAYASFVPLPGVQAAPRPARLVTPEWADGAQVEDRLVFRIDGVGGLPNGGQQIFVVDAYGGSPLPATRAPLPASGDFTWTADGNGLIFSADRRENAGAEAPDSELHRVDLATSTISQLTDRRGPDTAPTSSPDGRHLAYLGYDDRRMGYHNTLLYVADADGSNPRALTESLDRSVGNPQWSADGRAIYVQYVDHGLTQIARVSLDGRVDSVVSGLGGANFGRPYTDGSFTVARNGQIAATVSTPTRPANIATGNRRSPLRTITRLNEDLLAFRSLSDAEDIRWNSPHDGREVQGWALYPPGFDPEQTYPLILEIHGGPFTSYGPVFTAELQLMAAAGYVVLYTNPRGSTSYGDEFANLIHHDYPGSDYDDLMGGVDAMIARGFIDEDRLFVTGGSGGGVLTAWIIGKTNRFAAAAVVKPVINWASFVLYSDLPQFFYRYWFAAPPWEIPEEYWRRSPLSLVGNVTTPTLMMVGGADVRTPRAETEQYYSALHLQGVPTRLVVIPDSFHGISNSRPSRLLSKVAEILRWFEDYDPARSGNDAVETETANP